MFDKVIWLDMQRAITKLNIILIVKEGIPVIFNTMLYMFVYTTPF